MAGFPVMFLRLRTGIAANALLQSAQFVMPGLVPGIHVFKRSLQQDVDGLNKSGHDANNKYCPGRP